MAKAEVDYRSIPQPPKQDTRIVLDLSVEEAKAVLRVLSIPSRPELRGPVCIALIEVLARYDEEKQMSDELVSSARM